VEPQRRRPWRCAVHPPGRDGTVELGGDLSTVYLYLAGEAVLNAAGTDAPIELVEELGASGSLLEQVRSMDGALRYWEPSARTYVDQLGVRAAAQLVRRHRVGRGGSCEVDAQPTIVRTTPAEAAS
jgi:AraC family transcriptional regulator